MNKYDTQRPVWRDLLGFVIYFFVPMIFGFIVYLIAPSSFNPNEAQPKFFILTSLFTCLSVITFFVWSHRRHLKANLFQRLRELKSQIKAMFIAYILYAMITILIAYALKFLPKAWQFNTTTNQKAILELFQDKTWLPLVFILLVILTPITEELLFRHVIIGELGKKLGVWMMGAISVLVFAMLHVAQAKSPFEILPYITMGLLFVIMYIRSNCNIAVSIALHMLVNAMAFLGIILQSMA
ncbi:CPBP family intramembrane glutamic endopeptidase [Staphylococcus hyicus]|uniref:CPBP family intramembrane glutamic endopeptidase n=1 Tax=Staphylococcus hyicus TaxID=1284 RepID=UPI00208FD750|nr:CPBP family intramembrane glutamic endopeptidase [Staphylococcus hyicus]MCO4328588.1 CPBP family intramembrane metalloprotease [Staphylococcus hyicus]MCO4332215.1 CPBP family intramembrane metalloprotease [Staphylococcus hyicus]MCO4334777.1 CPBP family intramembrane metalloprotease [Staphylococcus hyicus]MCO4335470.1 CPBP family intramembrane metalloprotease [Staphylococcus hyicus]